MLNQTLTVVEAEFIPSFADYQLEVRIQAETDLEKIVSLVRQRRPEYAEYIDTLKLRRICGEYRG